MERTVPTTASEEIELYLRTYYSLLRTTAEIQIRTLEEAHSGIKSLLHPSARQASPDMSAFIYCLLRLPDCIFQADLVVLGQGAEDFERAGFGEIEQWTNVSATARRRRSFFNGRDTLACYIASQTDIDDLIPLLTAFQIEWNKLHALLADLEPGRWTQPSTELATLIQMPAEDLDRLRSLWVDRFEDHLAEIAGRKRRIRIQLLSGSLSKYRRATLAWMDNIEAAFPELRKRPVYFISSNTHSVANMLSGYALVCEGDLIDYIQRSPDPALRLEWEQIQQEKVIASRENFLYYVLKKYQERPDCAVTPEMQAAHERASGIGRVASYHSFDVEAQVIEINKLRHEHLDPRLLPKNPDDLSCLSRGDALILNIDYPLGLAAYNILSKVGEHSPKLLGVYVLGKAATLNGVIGDVMIPNVIHDEHSRNTYLFSNCFSAMDVTPYIVYGSVLDNQKAVTVLGTFLQNNDYMDVFYREGYTDIEMEAGPFLSAIFEMSRPKRHPTNEIVNLTGLPFDVGMVHYASDTPLSKGRNLGAGHLSYFGLDSTYASTIAILRRIFYMEKLRLAA